MALASGTTVYATSNIMDDLSSVTVYTSSMQAADYLSRCAALEAHICGGIIRSRTGYIIGNDAVKFFDKLTIDCAFLSCDAVGKDDMVYSDNIAASWQAVIMNSEKLYVPCDFSELGKRSAAKISTLRDSGAFITGRESGAPANNCSCVTEVIYV